MTKNLKNTKQKWLNSSKKIPKFSHFYFSKKLTFIFRYFVLIYIIDFIFYARNYFFIIIDIIRVITPTKTIVPPGLSPT